MEHPHIQSVERLSPPMDPRDVELGELRALAMRLLLLWHRDGPKHLTEGIQGCDICADYIVEIQDSGR